MVVLRAPHIVTRRPLLRAFAEALWYVAQAAQRPRTRAECASSPRPCVWASCRYHALLHVSRAGALQVRGLSYSLRRTSRDQLWLERAARVLVEAEVSCVLDLADQGPRSLVEIARLLDRDIDRVRQAIRSGGAKLRAGLERAGIDGAMALARADVQSVWDDIEDGGEE